MPDHQPPKLPSFPGYAGMELAALRRYVRGECTAEEGRRVAFWAAASSERRRYLTALRALYQRASVEEARSAGAAWERVVARMMPPDAADDPIYVAPWEEPAAQVDLKQRQRARILQGAFGERRRRWPVLAAAAAAVFAIGGIHMTLAARTQIAAPRPAVMRQIITARGQRAEIQLEDGSRVVLGVASRLRLSSDFGASKREVYLDGTAYFDVKHDTTRPFVVRTTNAVARDVGTRFIVSAYPESRTTRVVVRDGAVAFGAIAFGSIAGVPTQRPGVLLTGGHLGQLRAGDSIVTTQRVDPALYTAWVQGELVFHDEPLAEAVAELRRWYQVDIRLGDPSLRDTPITASFAVESSHEALSVITTVLPLRAIRRGNVVTLYRR